MNLSQRTKRLFAGAKDGVLKGLGASKTKFLGLSRKNKIIVIVSAVLVITLLSFFVFGNDEKKAESQTYIEAQATVGSITETIEQSGVIEPYERYEITSLVRGEIMSSPFEEGDSVEEGDTLYQIDDEDAQLAMEKAQMSLEEANDNVAKLNIYASATGRLTDFTLEKGNSVGGGIVGRIINTDILTVDIPFSTSNFEKIEVGDSVTITSSLYMTSLSGRVSHKYYANSGSGAGGSVLKNIEIEIDNPGALAEGTTFAATVHTRSGDVSSSGSGTIDGGTITEVRAEVSGTVAYVAVKDGDYVSEGQLIATLKNSSIINSQKNGQISVRSNQKTLDQYNITAPISGTVITKNSKAGDKIDSSNSQTVMMVIADVSKMKFTISVDELDIADIKLGQTAVVDADAIPDTIFNAKVTSIASEGVSSGDGVTTFMVELTIDEPGELKSGMNVNANILINEAHDVVTVPEDALMSVRGNTATVLVKSDGKKPVADKADKKPEQKPEQKQNENASGMKAPNGAGNSQSSDRKMPGIPDGYEIRPVTVGISDGINIEIVSGLSAGETVAYIPSTGGSGMFGFPGMMMGGGMMRGGSMPNRNRTGGGMPSGR